MSCGEPHDVDCSKVLDQLYEFIDGEMDAAAQSKIRVHLDECAPCLAEYDLDTAVKALLARSPRSPAPDGLRARILARINEARVAAE